MHTLYYIKTAVIHYFVPGYPPKWRKIHSKGQLIHRSCAKRFSTFYLGKFPPYRTAEVVNFTRHISHRKRGANVTEIIDFHKIKTVQCVPTRIANDNFV